MRKIQNIAFVLLATLFASCINDHIEPTFCRDGELSISVSTRSAGTRGQGANDDMPAAESIVKDLQYFLYVKGSGEDAAPIYAGTITDITDNDGIDNDADRPDTPADEDDNFSKTVQIPAVALNQLFPNGATECEIYIIANYLDNTKDAEHLDGIDLTKDLANATRKNLKAIELNTTFYELVGDVEMTPTSFVMDSEGTTDIVSRGTGKAINTLKSGTIYLTRAAAKVMIEVNVQNAIDVSGNTWEPITQIKDPTARKMFISFYNGVTTGVIDDGTDEARSTAVPTVTDAGAYYKVENVQLQSGWIGSDGATGDTSAVTRADESTSTSTSTSWVPALDFYSYANSWTAGDETHEPYFEISIPWRKKAADQNDSANWVTYTYTVPIAMDNNRFDRNKLYLIRLNVGALGDLSTLEEYQYSYVVLNWDEVTVNATLTRPKYFVVEEEYVEVYNQDSYGVNYKASDVVSAQILSVIKPDYSTINANNDNYIYGSANSTSGTTTFTPNTNNGLGNTNPFTVSVENGQIVLKHELNNNILSDGFDYVPYTVTVRATMTITDSDGKTTTMYEDITFKQYPAIYVQNHLTDASDTNSNLGSGTNNYGYGYVMVNTLFANRVNYTNSNNASKWQTVESFDSSSYNPNMYVITTTALDSSMSGYILADSRDLSVNQTSSNVGFTGIADVNGKYLTKYHPTKTDNENYLSPKFRICSAYGQLGDNSLTLQQAKNRCAAYQEDGYPAGRWRLATRAELRYIALLCSKGAIPSSLFGSSNYWCATTRLKVDTGGGEVSDQGNSGNAYMRCVYDDWYWGSEQLNDKTKYTWGDQMTTAELNNL